MQGQDAGAVPGGGAGTLGESHGGETSDGNKRQMMSDYFVNSNGKSYCGHKHRGHKTAEKCNPSGKVFCYAEPPAEGSRAQYAADAEEDGRSAD